MGLRVTDSRNEKAVSVIKRLTPRMEFGELEIVMRELGIDTYMGIREDGRVTVRDLTDLQMVAFAAALSAYVEAFHPEW